MISVLVIEDDPQISRLIESTLTAEGYHCECALDGQIGADCIEEKVYDLILLDLMLPQISGYELLEYIVTVGTPVIIISAMGQVKDRIRGLRMGADDYLSKPFQIEFAIYCHYTGYMIFVWRKRLMIWKDWN